MSNIEIRLDDEVSAEGQFKNRNGMEIIASIIIEAMSGVMKTYIMYKANLNYYQLQRYLNFLEINGLLKVDRSGKASIYEATQRGMEFLKDYRRLESYL